MAATPSQMHRLLGIGASDGVAVGAARLLAPGVVVVDRRIRAGEIHGELQRLQSAVASTDALLGELGQQLGQAPESEGSLIVEAHRMLLTSDRLVGAARVLIRAGLAAESAVRRVVDGIVATFNKMRDPYLRERGADIEAVGEQLLGTLLEWPAAGSSHGDVKGAIGIGLTLSPIDAFHLGRAGLAGLVTERGGRTSHAAIILKALQIPYVLGVTGVCGRVRPSDTLVVDGRRGDVVINPDCETVASFHERRKARRAPTPDVPRSTAAATTTADGTRVQISANIEAVADIAPALELCAEAVGLFRTELLYLHRRDVPTEEEQYRDAVAALEALGGRTATFRTLDVGGDKLPLGVKLAREPNPNLGVRAIRFSLRRPDIFRAQLRALYRASARGPLRIMFPLISGVTEMREALAVCACVRSELDREGVAHRADVPIGAMLETPSAVLTADHLSRWCDFFSIGTNDLIQYALAADRDNYEVHHLYQPLHPAVLRLLKCAVDAAAAAQTPISVCGDMAADPSFTWVLLGLGLRDLSMAHGYIPAVRAVIANTPLAEAQALVAELLQLGSDREVEERVTGAMQQRPPIAMQARVKDRDTATLVGGELATV